MGVLNPARRGGAVALACSMALLGGGVAHAQRGSTDRAVLGAQVDTERARAPEGEPTAGEESPVRAPERYPRVGHEEVPRVERYLAESDEGVPVYLVFEEMLEEMTAALEDAPTGEISPVAVRRPRLSRQLSGWFGDHLQAQVIQMVSEHTDHTVRRCARCDSLHSRVEGGEWVVTLGMTDQDQARREAELLGVRSFMDIRASYYPEQNVASLMVEVISADDATVLFSRSFRSDATTSAVLRTGDRIESRADRVAELERRLEQRPLLEHQIMLGAGLIPVTDPNGMRPVFGLMAGYRLIEHFGEDNRWLVGIGLEGFVNWDEAVFGGFINMHLEYDLLPANLNDFSLRTGPGLGAFIAGEAGNSFVAEWSLDGMFQFLLGAGISVFYFVPVSFGEGTEIGGFGGKVRVSFFFR